MDTHHVHSSYNNGMSFTANIDDHKVIMDGSDEVDHTSGASPKKLMLASLAGCTGIDVISILNKMKVIFSEFSIEISATLTDIHPKIYNKVKIIYKIKLSQPDRPKMEKAVKLSQDKYCGVSAMFKAFSNLKSEIIYL